MRSVDEIYQEMLAKLAERCGFQPEETCDLAVRLYAAAAQVQALDIQAEWVLDQSFPQTAQGIYLERHAAMRGLKRQEASKASGMLRFCVESASAADLEIPEGSVCMTEEERRFRTTGRGVLKAGELFVDVPAQALEGGSAFNAAPGTITIMTACPVGITACTNPGAFSGGSDPEEDESLRSRVLESYRRLPNGANTAWYERSAMAHAGVAEAKAVGRRRGIGTVDVFIAAEGGMPDAEMLENVRADLQEKREIAVDAGTYGEKCGCDAGDRGGKKPGLFGGQGGGGAGGDGVFQRTPPGKTGAGGGACDAGVPAGGRGERAPDQPRGRHRGR